jgi:Effector-associated domain 11
MTLIETIRDMIAEGQTEKSLDELLNYVKDNNDEVMDKLILLKSRMNNLNKSIVSGTIDNEEAVLERAKINESVLKILNEITPSYLEHGSPTRNTAIFLKHPQKSSNKTWIYVLVGVVIAGVAIAIYNMPPSVQQTTPIQQKTPLSFSQPQIFVQVPLYQPNILKNNEYWMRIWLPGRIVGGQGRTCMLVTHFLYNGKLLFAHPKEVIFRDIYGNVAVGTQPFIISSNDFDVSSMVMEIPYSSLNLNYTGGKVENTIDMNVDVYIDGVFMAKSDKQSFGVKW